MNLQQDYKKYKWFFTSSGKLVIGGKSAEQNEQLLKSLKNLNKNYIVMHTSSPGSPFSVIISDIKKIKPDDLEEAAIFTACFSQAWKNKRKKEQIHIFKAEQIFKKLEMKLGTFGVSGKINKRTVELKLALTKQKGKLRCVPIKTSKALIKLKPGNMSKEKTTDKILQILKKKKIKASKEEIMQALPAGGFSIKLE